MSDEDKISSILNAIQDDANLLILLKGMVTINLPNVPSPQLDAIMAALGLS